MAAKTTAPKTSAAARTAVLVEGIKAHAAASYEQGWDVVVETMTDEDIAEAIGSARTLKGAIAKLAPGIDAHREQALGAGVTEAAAELAAGHADMVAEAKEQARHSGDETTRRAAAGQAATAAVIKAAKAKVAAEAPARAPAKAAKAPAKAPAKAAAKAPAKAAKAVTVKAAKELFVPRSGDTIRAAFKAAGTSYRKLGAEQGVNPHQINRMVVGKLVGVPADVAGRIAAGLGVPVAELFFSHAEAAKFGGPAARRAETN